MEKNTQQPVAYDIHDTDRGYWQTIRADDTKRLKHFRASPGAWEVVPLYTAPPVPRDVLMAAAEEVQSAVKNAARTEYNKYACEDQVVYDPIDLAAIADRYASKVQPEPVNQQMLAALKNVLAAWKNFQSPDELEMETAIAAAEAAQPVALTVWYGSMPESNGRSNWTAVLHRKGGGMSEGVTLERSEYPDRVRYEADRVRYLIGELEAEPNILDYDGELHSGYVAQQPASAKPVAVPDGWQLVPKEPTPEMLEAAWQYHGSVAYNKLRPDYETDAECYRAMLSAAQKPEGVE